MIPDIHSMGLQYTSNHQQTILLYLMMKTDFSVLNFQGPVTLFHFKFKTKWLRWAEGMCLHPLNPKSIYCRRQTGRKKMGKREKCMSKAYTTE